MSKGSLPRRLLNALIPLLVSVVVGLVFCEGAVRIAFRRGMDFDMEMWKYATQIKVPSPDPKVVHEHRPNGRAFLMGSDVTTESHGLRDRERTVDKPANTFRIVALGDSITMGWGVAQDKTYPAQLEALLNARPPAGFPPGTRFEVLNLGVGNYNTVQEVMRLKNIGLQFHPDLITLGWFINDGEPTPRAEPGFLIQHSYLHAFALSRRRMARGGVGTYVDYYRGLYKPDQQGWKDNQAALGELASLGKEHHTPVMAFLLPELHDLTDKQPFVDVYAQVAKACESRGLPVTDLFPYFKDHRNEPSLWVHPKDAHHNAEAQGLIAKGMYDAIARAVPSLVPGAPATDQTASAPTAKGNGPI